MRRLLVAVALLSAQWLCAHEGQPFTWHDLWTEWVWDPAIVVSLALAAGLYARGMRHAAGIARWERNCFWIGWATAVIALLSPLHPMGEVLFAAHMAQHELLMVIAAPLLVLGRPVVVWLWAIPIEARRSVGRAAAVVASIWTFVSRPLIAFLVHFVAVWVWHIPGLYNASVTNAWIHAAQHASFLLSGILFWWSLLQGLTRKRIGAGLFYLFATAVHTSVLGALLMFSDTPWYSVYALTAPDWGLTPLEDQQLGGAIMWVPPGFVYLAMFLMMFGYWLNTKAGGRAAATSLLALCLAGCAKPGSSSVPPELADADPARGRRLLTDYGCVTCHTIPGVAGATGTVGPPLNAIARRTYLAGRIENNPPNMVRWIRDPKSIDDKTAMPQTGISEADARHTARFLYTLR